MTIVRIAVNSAQDQAVAGNPGRTFEKPPESVLYALEAASQALDGSELVALSVCDTVKGAVDYSEGVYGFARAFRIAGAENVLMTLWPLA